MPTFKSLTVEWSQKLASNNNAREDWRARHSRMKKQRENTKKMLHFNRVKETLPPTPEGHRILVTMERLASHPLDPGDNHNGSFKAVRDEIAAYFGINDRHENELRFHYGPHVKAPRPAQPFVRVTFSFEEYDARRAVVTETPIALTPREWQKRGLLSSGVVRNRP